MNAEAPVIVTGAGSGIGRAIARRLLADARPVIITDINEHALGEFRGSLASEVLDRAEFCRLDVTNAADWEGVVERGRARFGEITGLVNNAGITRDASMLRMDAEAFDVVIATHVRASWLGCKAVIPSMRAGGRGSIVNISSSGRHGVFGQTNYSAAKAAIVGLTKSVALEQARYGIRSNAVAPGAIETPMTNQVPERVKATWKETILLGRLGQPEEIAAAAAFLLSEESSYINAHVLDVNGGELHL
ncbi:SDR family oxidoreductase [Leucobacter rhizosphaerae]|uniref:SDR family oxidoreductase n=1 Tax=Leucobacter rhizosphaerae TaxID=2932245 RepID=A0ABY4FU94_9MICO|nr:SDR family NAD(P)-dependent oxidoreductase [Leucobacter rhizosphaerae]UOQ59828.1 SDR family oxidoreductase [Leucobacter rhizosphaerae]